MAQVRHASDGGFWRCAVVSPYVANFDEPARAHTRPPSAAARDVRFRSQGGARSLAASPACGSSRAGGLLGWWVYAAPPPIPGPPLNV